MQLGFNYVTDKKSSSIVIYFQMFQIFYTEAKCLIKRFIKISRLKWKGDFFNYKVLAEEMASLKVRAAKEVRGKIKLQNFKY